MSSFGGTIKLTGEEAYKNALKQISAELGTVSSQMKLVNSVYSKNDTSQEVLAKRIANLNDQLKIQKDRVATLEKAYADYKKQIDQQTTEHKELVDQLDKEKAKLTEIGNTLGTSSNEYKAQQEVVDQLSKEVDKSEKTLNDWNLTLKKTESQLNTAQANVNKTTKELNDLGQQAKQAEQGTEDLGDAAKKAGQDAEKAKEGFTVFKAVIADLAANVIRKAADGLKNLASETVNVGRTFEASMSNVAAISGASADDLDKLTKRAEELGAKMPVTASQVADGFSYMAMAGWKTEDMLEGIEGILNLSIAAGADLATTSDIVTDALTAMGYAAGDAGRLADVMAAASSNANTNVELMGATFQYAAPIVGALGYSMEDTAVAIGLMANAGIKGDKAGTALRSTLTRLSAPPKECAKAMDELGISIQNADGTMKPLSTVIETLRKKFNGLSESQQTQLAKSLAGQEAMSGLLAIVNASEADFNKLTTAVKNSTGAAQKMSDTMQNNLQGDMTKLQSKIEGIQIQLYNKLQPALRKATEAFSKLLDKVDWNGLAKFAKDALGNIIGAFEWIIDNKEVVLAAINGIIAAFVAAKVATFVTNVMSAVSAVKTMITATGGLNTAMSILNGTLAMNPFALIAGLVVGLGVAMVSLASSSDQANKSMSEAQKVIQDSSDKLAENKQKWQELQDQQQDYLNKGMAEIDYYDRLYKELTGIVDANGKVKEGYEGRAQFITTTLADALGLEIEYSNGVIKGYNEIKNSIDKVIEAKKAKVIIDSQEAAYTEALQKRSETVKTVMDLERQASEANAEYYQLYSQWQEAMMSGNQKEIESSQQKMLEKQREVENLQSQLTHQQEMYNAYAVTMQQYEDNLALYHEGKYNEMSKVLYDYNETFQSAGDMQKAMLEEQIAHTETELGLMQELYKATGDQKVKTEIETSQKVLGTLKESLKQYVATTDAGLNQVTVEWSDALDDQLSEITGSKVEFRDAGDGLIQAYVNGQAAGEPKSKEEMAKIVDHTIKEVTNKVGAANSAAQDLLRGINSGVKNPTQQNSVFGSMAGFANNMLSVFKRQLGIQSPSKEFAKLAKFAIQGVGVGWQKGEDDVLGDVKDFGQAMLGTLNKELGVGIDRSVLDSVQNAIPSDFNANIKRSAVSVIGAAQNGSESLVGQFKQALSQMKIVMDDEEMGRFVDRTVSNLVYN